MHAQLGLALMTATIKQTRTDKLAIMATKQEIMHPDCLQDLLERYSGDCDLSHYITMLDVPRGVFNKRLAKMFAKGHVQRTVDTMMQENDANPDGAKIPQEMLQAVITKMNDWVCNLKLGLTQSYEQYRAVGAGYPQN